MSFQNLILNNIEILGYNHQNNFFGEKSFHYSTTKTLSIRGYVLDLTNTVGVKDILTDTGQIKNIAQNFQNVIINGVNFGIGKFISVSFDAGNWVRSTQFNADIEIYETANLQSLVSKEFTDINISNKRFDLIKSFSETFTLDFDDNTKILGGTHSIEIEYNADNKDLSVIVLAQSLAKELLNKSIPTNLSEYNYSTRQEGSYKILVNESYDVINGKCGFTKTFSYSTNNNTTPYSVNKNLSLNLEANGIVTVGESCSIQAEKDNPSLYQNSLIGLNTEIENAYSRCNNLFSYYKNKLKITENLKNIPLQKSVRINKVNGTIDYEINFNNDNRITGNCTFEYTSTIDRNENYIYTVSEDGSIVGIGSKNIINGLTIQYIAAQNNWNSIKNNIYTRSYNLWLTQDDKVSNNFNPISERISRSPYDGKITYSYKYSDDPSIRNDLQDIKRLELEINDDGSAGSKLLPIYKEFIIPNQTYAIVQNRGLTRQGTFSIGAKADISFSGQSNFNGFSYFDILKTQVRNLYNGGNQDKYLESASFTSDEIGQNVSYSEVYKYS